jgi:predicted small lipoprotein YifL
VGWCVLTLGIAVAIGGCGYKGPLYLPPAKVDAAKPVPIPAPDPDRPVPGEAAPPPQ